MHLLLGEEGLIPENFSGVTVILDGEDKGFGIAPGHDQGRSFF